MLSSDVRAQAQATKPPTKEVVTPSKPITAAIYARVSTTDQNCALQLTELRAYCARMGWVAVEYTETESSVKRRPRFQAMMADARLRRFDVVLVWKLDRFGRSVSQIASDVKLLDSWGVRFIGLTQSIDTDQKNPMSRLILTLMAAFAEFERDLIVERVAAGVAQYKRDFEAGKIGKERHSRSGKNLPPHRPRRIFDRAKAVALHKQGLSYRKIANAMGVPFSTVVDGVKAYGKPSIR